MRTAYRALRSTLPVLIVFVLCLLSGDPLKGQTNNQLPSPTGQINDFAGVVDPQSKGRLESLLANLKAKTKVAFYVVTVDTTGGQDIFKFSQELAASWNIGSKTSSTKTLLLVISVGSKTSFTQFSRLAQADLPEGVLGEMSQRMRTPLSAGRFSEAIDEGVLVFVSALAEKHGLAVRDLDKPVGTADAAKVAEVPTATEQSSDPPVTRPRVVKETKPSETETTTQPAATEPQPTTTETTSQRTPTESTPQPIPTDISQPATAESTSKPTTESVPESTAPKTKQTEKRTAKAPVRDVAKPTKNSSSSAKLVTPAPPPVDDEAEAEEVELTLTLPLPKRAAKLKTFLETHPDSKARPRATELLISTHAGLGDQYLKAGDIDAGVKQLLSAIEEADVAISDQLFFGVISQIPSNLYLRGQADAALKAATNIETKFGNDPKRLLNVAGFYVGIERGVEAARIAEL
ncbi:MAG TPA: TPM domain-containing protein, partial [Pyrinomonadaceae bacterium]